MTAWIPKCPQCGRVKSVRKLADDEYTCSYCNNYFGDPNDGGDHHETDASRRIERQEAQRNLSIHGKPKRLR